MLVVAALALATDFGGERNMLLKTLQVRNFRSIVDQELPCSRLTALIGRNNVGKSSLLQALDKFYDPQAVCSLTHFYNENVSKPIQIIVTYARLSDYELRELNGCLSDGELIVKKEFQNPDEQGVYYSCSSRNQDFDTFKAAKNATERTQAYEKLKTQYDDLPEFKNKEHESFLKWLSSWENDNPAKCSRAWDDGKKISFSVPRKESGTINLNDFTTFILVPATLDASADVTNKKGALFKIIEMAGEDVLPDPELIDALTTATQLKYNSIVKDASIRLKNMESELNVLLKEYNASTSIKLDWDNKNAVNIQPPKPDIKIVADDYATQVTHAGHGSQRVLIMAMLQYRVQTRTKPDHSQIERKNLNIVIGIEEPELHQHPNSLYSIAQTFRRFTHHSSAEDQLQIVYTTHAAPLVDLTDLENLRIVRKIPAKTDEPLQTQITEPNLSELMTLLYGEAAQEKSAESSFITTIQTIMTTDVKAGFFADLVVLVEGAKDKAAIIGVSRAMDYDLQQKGISVISCDGKDNLPKIIGIFKTVRVPFYAIWDNDFNENEMRKTLKLNEKLLQLCGESNDLTDPYEERVESLFACFNRKLHETLSADLGADVYNQCLDNSCNSFCLQEDKGKTNPEVIEELCSLAKQKNRLPKTLIDIVQHIAAAQEKVVIS